MDHIKEKQGGRIQKDYLTFLLDIAEHYFKIEIPKIDGVSNFLGIL